MLAFFPPLPPVTHPAGDERRTLCVRNTCEGGGATTTGRKKWRRGSSFLSLRFLQHQEMRRARPAFPPLRKGGEISFSLLPTFPPCIPGISPGTAVNFAVVDGSFLARARCRQSCCISSSPPPKYRKEKESEKKGAARPILGWRERKKTR